MTAIWLTFVGNLVAHLIWPVIVIMIAFKFQSPISEVIQRIVSFEAWGAKATMPVGAAKEQAASSSVGKPEELTGSPLSEMPSVSAAAESTASINLERLASARSVGHGKPEIERRMAAIRDEMVSVGLPLPPDESSQLLLRHFAVLTTAFAFERIYRAIFGSQITALRVLSETGPHEMGVLRPYFETARAANPRFFGDYTFEQWLGYLVREKLIEISDRICSLTEFGKEFLLYLDDLKFPAKLN